MQPRVSKSKQFIAILSQHRSPAQIAMGIAMGLVIGLIPKDNLIALSLLMAVAALRVNQLAACVTAVGLSLCQSWFLPVSHAVGLMILQQAWVVALLQRAYTFPIVPWTCLENTIVIGGLLIGCVSILPTYLVCRWTVTQAQQQIENIELRQVANDAIRYRKVVAEQAQARNTRESLATSSEIPVLRVIGDSEERQTDDFHETTETTGVNSGVVFGSSPAANGSNNRRLNTREPREINAPSLVVVETDTMQDTILRETVIEVVRYRRSPVDITVKKMAPHSQQMSAEIVSETSGEPMASVNATIASSQSTTIPSTEFVVSKHSVSGTNSITIEAGHNNVQPTNREESLKYLLSHINGTRDSHRKTTGKST